MPRSFVSNVHSWPVLLAWQSRSLSSESAANFQRLAPAAPSFTSVFGSLFAAIGVCCAQTLHRRAVDCDTSPRSRSVGLQNSIMTGEAQQVARELKRTKPVASASGFASRIVASQPQILSSVKGALTEAIEVVLKQSPVRGFCDIPRSDIR